MSPKKATTKKPAAKKKAATKKASPKKAAAKKTTKTTKKKDSAPKKRRPMATLRGMKDILPKDDKYWTAIMNKAQQVSVAYGYRYFMTPVLEPLQLFVRSIGKGTDVVEKEMYMFEDKDGSKVCLRPEMTAAVARAYIQHGMHTESQPVKGWYLASMFRHDRPQAGRYRQFHQFGCESIGAHDPVIDAELICVAYNFYRDLGINTCVHMNSIGTKEDRERYLIELVGYLRSKRSFLSDISKKRLTKNPLRILDSKEEQDQAIIEEAPQILDWLSEDSKNYFMKVLEYLDELGIPYMLKPTLVRGLDYYTDTVFEFYAEDPDVGLPLALGGGGRYNGLIEQLGGESVPGCGFGLGVERTILQLKELEQAEGGRKDAEPISNIYFAHLGEKAKQRSLALIEELRRGGIQVLHNLGKKALKAQLEIANKNHATHAVILGQKELQDGTVIIRDMESGIQEIVDQKKIVKEIGKIAEKSKK